MLPDSKHTIMSETQNAIEGAGIPVRMLYHQLLDFWNQRNAEAMAELMTEDANVIGFDGSQFNGKSEIARMLRQIFIQHKTATYVCIVREIRFLSENIALLRAVAGMVPRGRTDINPEANGVQTMVAMRSGAEWKISFFQNTPAAFFGRPELGDDLCAELRLALSHNFGETEK